MTNNITKKVQSGIVTKCCWNCADIFRTEVAYDGIYTCHTGICQICKEKRSVTSANKLFGYHTFI